MSTAAVTAATLGFATSSASADWQPFPSPSPTTKPLTTPQVLDRTEAAFRSRQRGAHIDLSPLLARVARALPKLRGSERERALRLLARPSDGASDPQQSGWSVPEAPQSPRCSAHFCVHWVATGPDAPDQTDSNGDGVPDWIDTVLGVAENVYSVENGQLGWRPPKPDGTLGGNGLTDIYLSDLGGSGIYGYTAPDPGQQVTKTDHSQYAYLVLDNDFSPSQFPGYASPVDPLDVTVAHEYNHALQFNYDSLEDTWMLESTAVWAEGKVYEPLHDYLQYLPGWAQLSTQPITAFNGLDPNDRHNVKVYGSSVWNKWLDAHLGQDVVRAAWEDSLGTKPQSFAPAAYDAAIRQHGGQGFADQFDRFVAASAEWQASNSGFPEGGLYPDVRRVGGLRVGTLPRTVRLDHTSFALVDVSGSGSRPVKLAVKAPSGTRAALALVGRTGPLPGGVATSIVHELPHGGSGTVVIPAASGFARLTAVLINSDTSQRGYSNAQQDWIFAKNAQRFYVDVSSDFTRPRVRSRSASRRRVGLTFSERMTGVTAKSFELFDGRHRVSARVKFSDGSRRASLAPRRSLRAGHRYRVRLTAAITDLALNRLRRPTTWTFTAH